MRACRRFATLIREPYELYASDLVDSDIEYRQDEHARGKLWLEKAAKHFEQAR